MKINQIVHLSEDVAGPKNCWPGYKKTGTQPGTGKNKGKRVNDCEKIKQQGVAEGSLNEISKDTLKSYGKKAVADGQASQKRSQIEIGKAASTKDDETAKTHYDAAKQAKDRTEKRMAGISGAIKRLTKQGVAEGSVDKKPYPKTWHDVDPKIAKLVDKMSPEEKVKKGYSNPSILKKKKEQGVAENKLPKPYKKWAS